mmetsp:Transcript_2044/g.4704  ORF Transcript_2044/g.4704 Transcript_2044/m.4704 type:complete len:100 (-) Transcript_2044:20-319(-)
MAVQRLEEMGNTQSVQHRRMICTFVHNGNNKIAPVDHQHPSPVHLELSGALFPSKVLHGGEKVAKLPWAQPSPSKCTTHIDETASRRGYDETDSLGSKH